MGDSDDSDDEYDDEFAQAITNTAAAAAAAQAAAEAESAAAADTATPSGDVPREGGTDATSDAPASMTPEEQALSFAAAAVKSLGDSETQATTPYKVAITGSTGMIGTALTKALMVPRLENRHNPVVLRMVRGKAQQSHDVRFLPDDSFVDVPKLEACEAIVNLAGQPLGMRLTERSKYEVFHSRRKATEVLAAAIMAVEHPPRVVVSASGIGYYGNNCGDAELTEESPYGGGFLGELAEMWEDAIAPVKERGVRVVNARIGVVLDRAGGALPKMLPPFQLGVGGTMGSGRQYMSCLSLEDAVRAIMFAIRTPSIEGAVNITSPDPVTNATFTAELGRVLRRPTVFPMPEAAVKLLMGAELAQETALASQRVLPTKLMQAGFSFHHPTIGAILEHALRATA